MSILRKTDHWSEKHPSLAMDVLRSLLGLVLIVKGVQFGRHPGDVEILIEGTPFEFANWMIIHYVIMVHLAGGAFILIGFLTRLAILFQLPILIGAVFLNDTGPMFGYYANLAQAITVLSLLLLFLFYGSGKYSIDEYLEKNG